MNIWWLQEKSYDAQSIIKEYNISNTIIRSICHIIIFQASSLVTNAIISTQKPWRDVWVELKKKKSKYKTTWTSNIERVMEKFKQNVESLLFCWVVSGRRSQRADFQPIRKTLMSSWTKKKKNNIIVKSYLAQIHYFWIWTVVRWMHGAIHILSSWARFDRSTPR